MFPRRGALAIVTTVLALVLLLQFKTPDEVGTLALVETGTPGTGSGAEVTPGPSASAPSATNGQATTPATPTPTPTAGSNDPLTASATTLVGPVVSTRYGNVEVQITIENGTITAINALALPTGGRSGQISRYVEPVLASEALAAQSARIDVVSGATYTSQAYARSLQAALDQAAIDTGAVTG